MSIDLCVQFALSDSSLPTQEEFQYWVEIILREHHKKAELTIRIVDETESSELNQTYRHRSGPTNVLSFPMSMSVKGPAPDFITPILGDIVICAPVVAREAEAQHKSLKAHWAHMVVHGILHLLGYDHQQEEQAVAMERLETRILHTLGYPNPYGDELE